MQTVRPALLILLLATACTSRPAGQRFPFHGLVLQIDLRAHQALIQHDDVPGLMQGMTMPFTIHDEKTLTALKPGDTIQATLVKHDYKVWLEDVKVLSHQDLDQNKPASSEGPHTPTPGEPVPDFAFTNQNGKRIHLAQLHGHPVLLTFIYTRCPLPDFCPRMNANLLAAAKKSPGLQLLSISFDPAHDTPAVLHQYSQQWIGELPAAQRNNWQFVTPNQADLKTLLTYFGLLATKDADDTITHTLSTTLIAPDGKVAAWYHGNEWAPDDVTQALSKPN